MARDKIRFRFNLAQSLANSPGALVPWLQLESYCRHNSDLTERQRIIIILIAVATYITVGLIMPHWLGPGIQPRAVSLIRQGRVPQDIAEIEQVVCQIADEIVAVFRVPQAM